MKTIPMYYEMPQAGLRDDLRHLFPIGTSTGELVQLGYRTGTTRNRFAEVGEVFKIQNCTGLFVVEKVHKINLETYIGQRFWESLEGWNALYAMAVFPLQIYHGAWQTVFKKVDRTLSVV